MNWLAGIFSLYPVIPIFLTVGIGFWLGKLKYKNFSLGVVAATLLVGVIIGQLNITIPPLVKSIFFILFLFSIGYSVGPQFFHSLRGRGIKQVGFAIIEAMICVGTVMLAATIMGYDTGETLGLFAGSQTCSASLGVISDTVNALPYPDVEKNYLQAIVPACYAVTCIFGAIGSAWFLSMIGPRMLGGITKVQQEAAAIENSNKTGTPDGNPQTRNDTPLLYEAFKAESDFFNKPRSVAEIKKHFNMNPKRLFILRVSINNVSYDEETDMKVKRGDILIISGNPDKVKEVGAEIGPNVLDAKLMNFTPENQSVTVSAGNADGKKIGDLANEPYMNGVTVCSLQRGSKSMPALSSTELMAGDVLVLSGLAANLNEATSRIGFKENKTTSTDMVFLGLGIAAGCLLGALSLTVKSIPLSLTTTGGALIAGLILGWWRNRHPKFGYIPPAVVWFIDNLGLSTFIAIVGLTAGPSFIPALQNVGIGFFFVGAIATLIPMTICILIGKYLFRFSGPETLGSVAGARCGVAAIGAIQDAVGSTVPMLSYTVTYAVANFILVFSSLIILFVI